MMHIIQEYFINVQAIGGGFEINLGYPTCVMLIWFVTAYLRRTIRRKSA